MTPVLDPATDPAVAPHVRDLAPLRGFSATAQAVVAHLVSSCGLPLVAATRVSGEEWVVLATAGDEAVRRGEALSWSDSLCSRMVRGLGPRVAPVVAELAGYAPAPVRREVPIGAYLGMPLVGEEDELLGTLCAIGPQPSGPGLHAALPLFELQARVLSGLLATEVAAARQARADELARLRCAARVLGPVTWRRLLEHEERRCSPLAGPASVVALALRAGAGDRAAVERLLLECRRANDVVARTGPATYALLLPDTPEALAEVVASDVVLHLQALGAAASCGVSARGVRRDLVGAWQRAEAVRRRAQGTDRDLVARSA